jgi:UDPglucose 6-dehydrogenase
VKISVFGVGYVGLVSGLCFAALGHSVCFYDIDADKITSLNSNKIFLHEKDLVMLLENNLQNVCFTTDLSVAVSHGEILIITVGTPAGIDGRTDLQDFYIAIESIALQLNQHKLILIKSTIPVGTTAQADKLIAAKVTNGITYDLAFNPEFMKEGDAVSDFMTPDRIVIGTSSEWATEQVKKLYLPFIEKGIPFIVTDVRTAELSKYVANAFLATKITFMNEMSHIAEHSGADIEEIKKILAHDQRIGGAFLSAGCGYGGSCLPKDIASLINMSIDLGCTSKILEAVQASNTKQQNLLFYKLKNYFQDLQDKTVALWGLAFKPNTDDIRHATSGYLIELLCAQGVMIKAYDPAAIPNARIQHINRDKIIFCETALSALMDADALLIVTEWDEFRNIDLTQVKAALKMPIIFDGRNMFGLQKMKTLGFDYISVGRDPVNSRSDVTL